jgi:molecular chaperone GrpE
VTTGRRNTPDFDQADTNSDSIPPLDDLLSDQGPKDTPSVPLDEGEQPVSIDVDALLIELEDDGDEAGPVDLAPSTIGDKAAQAALPSETGNYNLASDIVAVALQEAADSVGDEAVAAPAEGEAAEEVVRTLEESNDLVAKLEVKVGRLHEHVEEARNSAAKFKALLYRKAADLENNKRRMQKQMAEIRKFGIEGVLRELLPVIDDLERAIEHAKNSAADPEVGATIDNVLEGVVLVRKKFSSTLERFGVVGFESIGEEFDPQLHEAIAHVTTTDLPTGTVAEEFLKGYMLHERLLRPAVVGVARQPSDSTDPEVPAEAPDEPDATTEAGGDTAASAEAETVPGETGQEEESVEEPDIVDVDEPEAEERDESGSLAEFFLKDPDQGEDANIESDTIAKSD